MFRRRHCGQRQSANDLPIDAAAADVSSTAEHQQLSALAPQPNPAPHDSHTFTVLPTRSLSDLGASGSISISL
ncbi:MAG TPA: hypothetical protein PLP07_00525 [Pyrinomonadaceae bacterium]|nr:hypothetical protein [Pyrinomonadaceae bacterium]HQY66138.1 hypothetical protein [Pyrinomonadaceae bacterium]HRA38924.1 hypothetical protein [Pyrinomonadaceae bacterium]